MVQVRLEITQEEIRQFQKRYLTARNKSNQVAQRLCERDWVAREIIRALETQACTKRGSWITARYDKAGRWAVNTALEPCVWEELIKAVPQYDKEVQEEVRRIAEAQKAAEEKRLCEKVELAAKLGALAPEIKKVCAELEPYDDKARLEIAGKLDALPSEFTQLVIRLCGRSYEAGSREHNIYNNHLGWVRNQVRYFGIIHKAVDTNSVAYKSFAAFVNGSSYAPPGADAPATQPTSARPAALSASRFDANEEAKRLNEDLKRFTQHYRG